jgi:hypothetical protein
MPLDSTRRALLTGICPTQNGVSHLGTFPRK